MNRTKEYIKMVIFVLVLGLISAGLLVGIDALTNKRIEQNKLFKLYSAILDANGDEFNQNNFVEVFETNYTVLEPLEETTYIVYQHNTTKNLSFEFEGNGMWGPIKGVLTLEEDFLTIVDLKILEQEETPGLGARISEDEFLDRFVGQKFPNITILKDREPIANNEIAGLTGATTTTGRFQALLNANFMEAFRAYMGDALEQGQLLEILKAMLEAHEVNVLEGDDVNALVEETFDIVVDGELKVYVNNNLGLVSFIVYHDIHFGQTLADVENIPMVITLRADVNTIDSMVAIYAANDGHWGKTQLLDNLNAEGITFPITAGTGINITGVTGTGSDVIAALNSSYDLYFPLLETLDISGGDFGETPLYTFKTIQELILLANNVELSGDLDELFARNIITIEDKGRTVYINDANQTVSFTVDAQMRFGILNDQVENVLLVVTLENDGVTIKDVSVVAKENADHLAKEALFSEEALLELVTETFPRLKITNFYAEYYPVTTQDFELALNLGYDRHKSLINSLDFISLANFRTMKIVLSSQGNNLEELTVFEIIDLYDNLIDVVNHNDQRLHINKENNQVTMEFIKPLRFGRNGSATTNLDVLFHVTLASDFETILNVSATHNQQTNHWGKRDLLIDEVLALMVNMKFPNLVINEGDIYLGVTGVTLTGQDLDQALNEAYDELLPIIESNFDILEKDSLKLITNKVSNNSTFYFTKELTFGNQNNQDQIVDQEVKVYVTIASDFITITNISATFPAGNQWGKTRLLTSDNLANAKGMKFPNLDIKNVIEDALFYFEATRVTVTGDGFEESLNEFYDLFENTFWGDGA